MSVDELAGELLDVVLGAEPVAASLYGVEGYDAALGDPSVQAQAREADALDSLATRAEQLDASGLDSVALATRDFVLQTAAAQAPAARVPSAEFTISGQMFSPVPGLLQLLSQVALSTPQRGEGYLTRLAALPAFVEAVAERHRDGLASGRVGVARLVQGAMDYVDALTADPDLAGLRQRCSAAGGQFDRDRDQLLDEVVVPALRSYRDQLAGDVLAAARDDDHPGLVHLPDGAAMYAAKARSHIGVTRSPGELHELGVAMAAELADELAGIGRQSLGSGNVAELIARLRDDASLRYHDGAEMITQAKAAVTRACAAAPRFFGRVPDEVCRVVAVPDAAAPAAPPAYYMPPALDGSRPGTYFVNTYRADQRARHNAESVAFHEAVPGHHFQMALAQQQSALPLARRLIGDTATLEGWGLYAERLADEMGLYSEPLARMGMVANDMWRAARLVLDTGLHDRGWTRAEAIAWMAEHTPTPLLEIETEVDRYIAYPGQALSYMVGRLELQAMRERAAAARGAAFDLRAFHDLVLSVGPLPLAALASVVARWAAG